MMLVETNLFIFLLTATLFVVNTSYICMHAASVNVVFNTIKAYIKPIKD